MTAKELPARPNLDQYPETGEGLLESYRAGDPDALSGIQHHHPQFKNTPALSEDSFQLSDAQWVIAREYGLESWPGVRRSRPSPRGGGLDFAARDACLRNRSRRRDG